MLAFSQGEKGSGIPLLTHFLSYGWVVNALIRVSQMTPVNPPAKPGAEGESWRLRAHWNSYQSLFAASVVQQRQARGGGEDQCARFGDGVATGG